MMDDIVLAREAIKEITNVALQEKYKKLDFTIFVFTEDGFEISSSIDILMTKKAIEFMEKDRKESVN